MSKIDENETLRRLKLLSKIEPTSEATDRAIKRVRNTLIDIEKGSEDFGTRVRWFLKKPIAKLAAAAVIIVGIGLFSVRIHQGTSEKSNAINVSEIAKSPVEMVTAMSLERAFRRGGIEAVEKQCQQAFQPRGLQPGDLSVDKILAEFNGNGKSSKGTRL